MKVNLLPKISQTLTQAAKATHKLHWALQIPIFVIVLMLSMVPTAIAMGVVTAVNGIKGAATDQTLISLLLLVLSTIAILIYTRYIEGRDLTSVGFVKRRWFRQYARGLVVGSIMIWSSLGLCLATGSMSFNGVAANGSASMLALYALGFMIQGMQEEVALRGYLMMSLTNRTTIFWAVLISSIAFGAMHIPNPGMTMLSFVNLILFGTFAGCYFLRTDSIWGIAAIHSVWNFSMGNLMGIEVSGTDTGPSVWSFAAKGSGEWINGGGFGLEGGLAVTSVFTIGIVALLFWPRKEEDNIIS